MPTRPPGTPDVDLTFDGASGTINGGVFMTGLFQLVPDQFSSFLEIRHNGVEQGYNTDGALQQDQRDVQNTTHSILLAEVPIVIGDGSHGTQEGVAYREFRLTLDEAGGAGQYLSLDSLQIWQEEAGNLTNFTPGAGFAGAHTNYLAYDLDEGGDRWIGLQEGLNGNGANVTEFTILIPDSAFINDPAHRYITLYSKFGMQTGWNADSSSEVWGLSHASGGPVSAMTVHKTAMVPGGTANAAGEVISYDITVANVGNTNLTGITVTDPSVSNLAAVDANFDGFNDGDINHDNQLSTGETWQYTANHTVTQSDLDTNGGGDGQINNTVTADSNQTTPVSASSSVEVEQSTHVTLTKNGMVAGGTIDQAGELVHYRILITNDGLVTLTNPAVTDPSLGTFSPLLDVSAPIVDENVQLFIPIVDGDFNLGDTDNDGIEEATDHNNVRDPGETWQYVYLGDITQDGFHDPGETWSAFNLGDTNDNGVRDPGETFIGDDDNNGIQDPGERWQFKNVWDTNNNGLQDNGEVWNYANRGDNNQNGVEDAPGETFEYANVGDTNQSGAEDPGETFQYYNAGDTNRDGVENNGETFQFTFTSNVAGVDANDDGFNDGDTNLDGSLNVGETWRYNGTYTATQDDIDNRVGGVPTVVPGLTHDNTASVSTNEGASDDGSASVPILQNPDILVTKSADVASVDAADDVINYTITVDNAGNMTLTDIDVTDLSVEDLAYVSGDLNNDNELDLDEIWTYSGRYTVTQDDIDNGGIVDPALTHDNTATVTTDQGAADADANGSDSESVAIVQDPRISLMKSGSVEDGTADEAGDVINYTINVSNAGNMTLTGIDVSDPSVDGLALVSGDDGDGKLELTETWVYTASYTVTQDDIDNGGVVNPALTHNNTASVTTDQGTALPSPDPDANDSDSESVAIVQDPRISLAKSGSVEDGAADEAGDVINYTIDVSNAGNMTLTGLVVTDPSVMDLAYVSGDTDSDNRLDLTEIWHYIASYTLTQDDIDNGGIVEPGLSHDNTASVTTDQGAVDADANDSDDESIPIVQSPSVTMAKDATVDGGTADTAGEEISYTIAVTNNGNMSLTGVSVSDPFVTDLEAIENLGFNVGDTNTDGKLSVGETWQYTASHTVTQAEIDDNGGGDGFIENTASVTTDQGASASDGASVEVEQPAAVAALALDKSDAVGTHFIDHDEDGVVDSDGDLIQYAFQITNTGGLALHDVVINDPLLGGQIYGPEVLDPGESFAFTLNYFLNAADVTAGHVENTATASGLDPSNNLISIMAHYDQLLSA